MIKEYRELFPKGLEENRGLILSDDIDSLFSCYMLNKINGQEITHFYNFKELYKINNKAHKGVIGVDIDFIDHLCWGNHTTFNFNPKSANINNLLKIGLNKKYTDKFCISTLLTILGYYNYDISHLNDEQKAFLLCVDGSYLGYYFNKKLFSQYIKNFNLDELLPLLEKHKKSDFQYIVNYYGMNGKINIKDGSFKTNIELDRINKLFNIDIKLPTIEELKLKKKFKTKYLGTWEYDNFKANNFIFSQAQVYKNRISLSYL